MAGSKNKHQVVFLFSELSYYFLSCLDSLKQHPELSVSVVHWDVNPEAPFQFKFPEHVQFFRRSDFDDGQLANLLEELQPEVIFCAGWLDKGYISILKDIRGPKKVLTMDNQWRGTLRQHIASLASPFNFIRMFDEIWVPGKKQKKFAKKLGFKKKQIKTGFYSADLEYFNGIYNRCIGFKTDHFPHVFLFLGRYVPEKGIDILVEAFEELQNENENDWELHCVGTGKLRSEYLDTQKIKHLGFVQPYELEGPISKAGVFVLPSTFEPWGLVVHECAAAGMPMILSEAVGSADQFANEGNAIIIKPGSKAQLKHALSSFMSKSDEDLIAMARSSVEIGQSLTPAMWAESLFSFLEK